MTYAPQDGDFGLTQITGNVGRLIRLGQWLNGDGFADYQHAFVYVGEGQVVEAMPGGAERALLSKYDAARVAWYSCPREHASAICEQATNLIGTPYSFLDYLALAALRLKLPLASRLLRGYVASSGHLICSALVDRAYERGGVNLFTDGRLPGDVTPLDLYGLIRKQRQKAEAA
ncbi:hypothetical protein [Streptomyces sp. ODS28]|uniref:hypothetical protein n=1 Tax=Streptomyces sp. ODS28 TaxID=3136688 RepID=UPI0031F0BA3E